MFDAQVAKRLPQQAIIRARSTPSIFDPEIRDHEVVEELPTDEAVQAPSTSAVSPPDEPKRSRGRDLRRC